MVRYIIQTAVVMLGGLGAAIVACEFLHVPFPVFLVVMAILLGGYRYWEDTQTTKGGGG